MNRIEKIQQASFKGVTFFVNSEQKAGGPRIHLKEYYNSIRQGIQSAGKIPFVFTLPSFVAGETWIQDSQSLESVLNETDGNGDFKPGRLVLPTLGSYQVTALNYTITATHRAIGRIDFSLKFAAGEALSAPYIAQKTVQDVYQESETTRKSLKDTFIELWNTPKNAANTIVAAYDTVKSLEAIASVAQSLTDKSDFVSLLNFGISSANNLINNADEFGDYLFGVESNGLFQTIAPQLNKTQSAMNAIVAITSFGNTLPDTVSNVREDTEPVSGDPDDFTIPVWEGTTADRIDRNRTRTLYVESFRLAALLLSYEQLASIDFFTREEIQEARQSVETAYSYFYESQADRADSVYTFVTVDEVRQDTLRILKQKEQEAFYQTTIEENAPGVSTVKMAYQLYGESLDLDTLVPRAEKLRGLNPGVSPTKIAGNINVFQAQ